MKSSLKKTAARLPPRDRILEAAADLFYRLGIRGVGVDAIARQAGTNKMTLYRHFPSKDALVEAWLRRRVEQSDRAWEAIVEAHPGDAKAQLVAWFRRFSAMLSNLNERGCPFANSLAELTQKDHPGRRIIAQYKLRQRDRVVRLCKQIGLEDPKLVAEELLFLLEGARVSAQSVGPKGIGPHLVRMAEALLNPSMHTVMDARSRPLVPPTVPPAAPPPGDRSEPSPR